MAEAAKKIPEGELKGPVDKAVARIRGTHTEELVIAICGPIGSGHHELTECLKERLADFNYEVEVIRLSKVIEDRAGSAPRESRFDRVKALQDKGNELRKKYRPDYLASKAIEIIALERQKQKDSSGDTSFESRRRCYIIDSIKHPAEFEILELTYREIFYCFGIYAPLHVREQNLRQQGMSAAEIYRLVDRDSGEEIEHGQQVRDAFVKSDFFLRLESSNYENLKSQAARYLTIIFGASVVTPTPHESAMHHAWVAAANSACLSRQVGAALVDKRGQLISVGWNDVPKYGGGLYHTNPGDAQRDKDHRCMYRRGGQCFNDLQKNIVAHDLFKQLVAAKLLSEEQLLEFDVAVRKTRIRGLIEFSRSIHAEMHAILSAIDSEGARVKGSKLFTTTYPCHSCARHIVAAGIEEVYYIEPYRKSLAIDLHDDAVTENETEKNKVKILPFHGVAPQRYFALFMARADDRKHSDTGKMKTYNRIDSHPVQEKSIEAFPTLEGIVVESLAEIESARGSGDEET